MEFSKMNKFDIHTKLRLIREAEGCGRHVFSKRTGIPKRTIENYENKGTNLRASYLIKLCDAIPEYALWLLTDEINLNTGQISPDVRNIWRQEQKKFNSLTIKIIEEVEEEIFMIDENTYVSSTPPATQLIPFDRFNLEHINLIKNIIKESKNLITDAIDTTDKLKE